MTPTDMAIWGSAVGTLTLLMNFWKERRSVPRVRANVEAVESFSQENGFAGIRFTLRNRGARKTIIESIFLYRRQGWFEDGWLGLLFRVLKKVPWKRNVGVSSPETVKLPAELDAGGMWEGFLALEEQDDSGTRQLLDRDIPSLISRGQLRYSIVASHTARPLRGSVKIHDWFPSE